jgi:hypothetical protein
MLGMASKGNFRSEKLKKHVREMNCGSCDAWGPSHAAHPNLIELGKGTSIKAHDIVFPLCHVCHYELDNGKTMSKAERRAFTWEMIAKTFIKPLLRGKIKICD